MKRRTARRTALALALAAIVGLALAWRSCAASRREARERPPATSTARDDGERRRIVEQRRRALQPALPRLALHGVVVDAAGAPVAGADVILAGLPAATKSGADGRFRFERLAAGTFVVEARHGDGYAGPVRVHLTAAQEAVTLRLYAGGRVEVRCVDAASGAPLANARAGVRMNSMFPGALDLEGVTGTDGVAHFTGMPAAGLEAWCAALGYQVTAVGVDSTQEGTWGVTVEVEVGVPVRGVVVDERGAPVANATIEVAPAPMPGLAGVKGSVTSGDDGRFVVPGVAPGAWYVHAVHGSYDLGVTPVEVAARVEPPPVTIVVGDGVVLAGVVATRSLEPAPGAEVDVRFRAGGRVFRTVQADGTGRFEARGLPHDELQLVARHDRAASAPLTLDTRGAGERDELLLVLDDDELISGVVLDAAGKPAPDVTVFFVHDTHDDDRATAAGAELTGDDGRFELHGLARGEHYVLTAMLPGHFSPVSLAMRSVGQRVRAGDDVTIQLPADGAIRGRVRMSDGAPPPADLRVRLEGTPQRVEADGVFVIEGIPPERHALRVDARGVPELVRGDIVVTAGEVTDVGDLVLTRGREVSGTVTDAGGRPIPAAEVSFVPVGIAGRLVAETDRRGRYRRALPTDRDCTITATAGDLGATPARLLRAGAADATVDLRFGRTGRITGIVRAAGRVAAGRFVLLDRRGDEPPVSMAATGADGAYELTVAGGTYVVSLHATDGSFVDRTVTVEAGATARVDFDEPAP